jgi:SAM-dependent methyltransferase
MCPACALDRAKRHSEDFWECGNCGLLYSVDMKPGSSEWYASCPIYSAENATASTKRWEFEVAVRQRPSSILDVGCGTGSFLQQASSVTDQLYGVDFNPTALELARARLPHARLFQSAVEEFTLPPQQYSMVTAFEVLEHLADPLGILIKMAKACSASGQVVVSVPCAERWPQFFDPIADRPPHHLTLWTKVALQALLERAGLVDIQISRKPLSASDLGLTFKWRLQAKKVPTPGLSDRKGIVYRSAAATLGAVSRALRVLPKAGSFTLAAIGRPKSNTFLQPSE